VVHFELKQHFFNSNFAYTTKLSPPLLLFTGRKLRSPGIGIEAPGLHHNTFLLRSVAKPCVFFDAIANTCAANTVNAQAAALQLSQHAKDEI